ncbi:fructose-bisphosphatase class II family protein [Brevundimonas sp. VNH65]|uniref:fructose-bisphosphatase class II family protein n=1 Tax=Brevundimonas sp. VNH65 TaxID=3400917 RepID=UPI003C114F3D
MADSAFGVAVQDVAAGLAADLPMTLIAATEAAAIAGFAHVGRGDEPRAHEAAWAAMRRELERLDIDGEIAMSDALTDADGRPVRNVGTRNGPTIDLGLDPLEGATLTAKAMGGALAVLVAAPVGGLARTPALYMDKIAIGPGFAPGTVDLERSAADNVRALAGAKGVSTDSLVVCVLDRPRNARLIADLRTVGARVRMISDGDIAGVIQTAEPEAGIDMYLGSGGASEGVLSAAALKCLGGFFQGRLVVRNDDEARRIEASGLRVSGVHGMDDLVRGPIVFAATGVTTGSLLMGVERKGDRLATHSLIMDSERGLTRRVRTERPV